MTNIPVHSHSPRLRRRFACLFLRRLCDLPFLYFRFHHHERFHFIVTRDSNSLLLGLQIIITRDYKSLLLGLQIIVTRDYKSLLREITLHYLNYTPAVHIHRRSEFTEDSFFLSTHTTSSVHSHSPRLRRRFAGPFLRRLCDPIHPSSGDRI